MSFGSSEELRKSALSDFIKFDGILLKLLIDLDIMNVLHSLGRADI